MITLRQIFICFTVALTPSASQGQQLAFQQIDNTALNCTFNTSCAAASYEISKPFNLHNMPALLWSRWYDAAPDSPGAGKIGYTYRVDLTPASNMTTTKQACVTAIQIEFGPVIPLNYKNDGHLLPAFEVVGPGSIGTIGLKNVEQANDAVIFTFDAGLCAGTSVLQARSSVYFGVAGGRTLEWRNATLKTNDNPPVPHHVAVRVPVH